MVSRCLGTMVTFIKKQTSLLTVVDFSTSGVVRFPLKEIMFRYGKE